MEQQKALRASQKFAEAAWSAARIDVENRHAGQRAAIAEHEAGVEDTGFAA